MFERWTERARNVIVLAQDAARAHNHDHIGTEHLLHGLVAEGEGIAARVLKGFTVSPETVDQAFSARRPDGSEAVTGQIPFTPRAKRVCELALREALSLGHNFIGTEHVLLGLLREHEGAGAEILREFGIDSEKARNEVVRNLMGEHKPQRQPTTVVLELNRETAEWLRDHMGARPHNERESAEIYTSLLKSFAAGLRAA